MYLTLLNLLLKYGWPLSNTSLNCIGLLTCGLFFNKHSTLL